MSELGLKLNPDQLQRLWYILPSCWSSHVPSLIWCLSHGIFTSFTNMHWECLLSSSDGARCWGYIDEWDRLGSCLSGPTIKGQQVKCLENEWMNEWMNWIDDNSTPSLLLVQNPTRFILWHFPSICWSFTHNWAVNFWGQRPFCSHMLHMTTRYVPNSMNCG